MADVEAVIQYGALPDAPVLVDEAALLVEDLRITPTRTKKEYTAATAATYALRYVNPQMRFDFTATISAVSGLADAHPGSQVDDLANYAAVIHGFDPDQGIKVYEDPVRQMNQEDPAKVNFTVMQYPFVADV